MRKILLFGLLAFLVVSFSSCFLFKKVPMTLLIDNTHNNSYNFDGYGATAFFAKAEALAVAQGYAVSYSSVSGFSPENYGAVLITAPVNAYSAQERDQVKRLLEKGGKVILLGEWYYYYNNANLNSIASHVGSNISFGNHEVIDATNNYQGTSFWPTTTNFTTHAVTAGLNKVAFFAATTLTASGNAQVIVHAEVAAGTLSTFALAQDSEASGAFSSQAEFSPSVTRLGLVAVSDLGKGKGKVVAVSDATLFANDVYGLIKGDFIDVHDNTLLFKNILNW